MSGSIEVRHIENVQSAKVRPVVYRSLHLGSEPAPEIYLLHIRLPDGMCGVEVDARAQRARGVSQPQAV